MKYYKVKKYVIEEFEVLAKNAKEARSITPEDPVAVTVTKITARKAKEPEIN